MEMLKKNISKVKALVNEQNYGVLATQHDRGLHTSIVAFMAAESLQGIFFATSTSSRKF